MHSQLTLKRNEYLGMDIPADSDGVAGVCPSPRFFDMTSLCRNGLDSENVHWNMIERTAFQLVMTGNAAIAAIEGEANACAQTLQMLTNLLKHSSYRQRPFKS